MSSAENELRCNVLRCRKMVGVEGRAVVTACSHIFCVPCAEQYFSLSQACPACDQLLAEPDDIVMSSLAPTTEYKASILAGLTPSVILEIAARAMSFWTYQTSQENAYLLLMLERSEDAKHGLESQLNHCKHEAKCAANLEGQGELHNARSKIAGECLCFRWALTQRGLLAELDKA
ncbi:hypothetical protein EHS25_009344 [Saitozyma podzolica]|uniref:RING-type domain-containing protein n=1 Tax=Saitozyma podzolica TaxID=1890683 RepID=A0A427YLL1_9TREE|nr:hypothetical protein EHS25_009344 [Saitozyma podzolica]